MKILIKLLNYILRPKYIVEYLLICMNLYLCSKRLLSAYECLKIKDIKIYNWPSYVCQYDDVSSKRDISFNKGIIKLNIERNDVKENIKEYNDKIEFLINYIINKHNFIYQSS